MDRCVEYWKERKIFLQMEGEETGIRIGEIGWL